MVCAWRDPMALDVTKTFCRIITSNNIPIATFSLKSL